jgi:hypothetical protein
MSATLGLQSDFRNRVASEYVMRHSVLGRSDEITDMRHSAYPDFLVMES